MNEHTKTEHQATRKSKVGRAVDGAETLGRLDCTAKTLENRPQIYVW